MLPSTNIDRITRMAIKITIEDNGRVYSFYFPEWAENQRYMLLAGMELLAIKEQDKHWEVKVDRCTFCGNCCMDMTPSEFIKIDDEGRCVRLIKEDDKWLCGARTDRPFRCLADPTVDCDITHRIVEPD